VRDGEDVGTAERVGVGVLVRVALVPTVGAGVAEAVAVALGVALGVALDENDADGVADAATHTPAAHASVALRQQVHTGAPEPLVQQQNWTASGHIVTESTHSAASATCAASATSSTAAQRIFSKAVYITMGRSVL